MTLAVIKDHGDCFDRFDVCEACMIDLMRQTVKEYEAAENERYRFASAANEKQTACQRDFLQSSPKEAPASGK
jgi:hypothetical protein